MSYQVVWRAAPAPFPLGSYRLADHQLKERGKHKTNIRMSVQFLKKRKLKYSSSFSLIPVGGPTIVSVVSEPAETVRRL